MDDCSTLAEWVVRVAGARRGDDFRALIGRRACDALALERAPHATSPPATSPPATSPPATSPPATSPPATSPRGASPQGHIARSSERVVA
jgi:hypothetical protein